jgi:hypothetical protein
MAVMLPSNVGTRVRSQPRSPIAHTTPRFRFSPAHGTVNGTSRTITLAVVAATAATGQRKGDTATWRFMQETRPPRARGGGRRRRLGVPTSSTRTGSAGLQACWLACGRPVQGGSLAETPARHPDLPLQHRNRQGISSYIGASWWRDGVRGTMWSISTSRPAC